MNNVTEVQTPTQSNKLFDRLARHLAVTELILRQREPFFQEIKAGVGLGGKIRSMMVASAVFLALYGAVLGSSNSWQQALSSAVKLPILFLLTSIICLPTLYLFNTLFGARQNIRQNLALFLTPITVSTVLLFSFAPIALFFLVTSSSYQFFKLMNVAFFTISGSIGMWFLVQGMWLVSDEEEANVRIRRLTLIFWIVLYAFVGSQMAWTLRPFVGFPEAPFELLRQAGGNFYTDIFYSIGEILGFVTVR